jgi:hypothetical protein
VGAVTGVVDTVAAWFLRGGYWPSIVVALLLALLIDFLANALMIYADPGYTKPATRVESMVPPYTLGVPVMIVVLDAVIHALSYVPELWILKPIAELIDFLKNGGSTLATGSLLIYFSIIMVVESSMWRKRCNRRAYRLECIKNTQKEGARPMKHSRTLLTGRVGSGKTTLVLSVSVGESTVLVSADPLPHRPEGMDVTVLRRGAPGFVVAKTLEDAASRARETGSTLVIDGLVPVRVPEIGGAPIRPVVDTLAELWETLEVPVIVTAYRRSHAARFLDLTGCRVASIVADPGPGRWGYLVDDEGSVPVARVRAPRSQPRKEGSS